VRKIRCAVYTRMSTEEGLDQEFNSPDAQRESCEAYITSQRAEGWVLVPDHYDDGRVSGGTLERPALKRLIADIEGGLVDVVVVYKIDRLSRSLMDFTKLVDVFDANAVTFVSRLLCRVTASCGSRDWSLPESSRFLSRKLGGVDGFEQDEAGGERDDGGEVPFGLLAA
jgi:hypothetical protein